MKKILLTLPLLLPLLLSQTAFSAAPDKGLCRADEKPLFQCRVKNKQLSLCAGSAGVQYRFGTPQNVELSYPATPQPAAGKFFYSETGYSGGGEERIRFRNGDYDYFLFERTVRTGFGNGPNNPEFSAGVITRRAGKVVSTRLCDRDDALISHESLAEEEFTYLDD